MNRPTLIPQRYVTAFRFSTNTMTLTNRQHQILVLIAAKLTTTQIVDKLGLSVPTIETHRENLLRKAGVRSVTGLMKEAILQGLIQ